MSTIDLSNFNLTFDEEFDSFTNSPDGSSGWRTTTAYTGQAGRNLYPNKELQYYSDSSVGVNPFSLSNGILSITANKAAAGSNPYNLAYTSGIITTLQSFHQEYGYFEARMQLPAGKGLWPAFWMLPITAHASELDIMEMLGDAPWATYDSVHNNLTGVTTTLYNTAVNTSTAFHTYGVDWEPDTVTFYTDGKATGTIATPSSMNVPMYLLLNMAVGGVWPGSPNASTPFPSTMQIDYVRAYASANTVGIGGNAALGTIQGTVGAAGPAAGAGRAGAVRDASGTVRATKTVAADGSFAFTALTGGAYQIRFTAPSGTVLQSGPADASSGLASVTLAAGQTVVLDPETVAAATVTTPPVTVPDTPVVPVPIALTMNGKAVLTPGAGTYAVTGNASQGKLTLGDGNHTVTLTGTADTVVTGNGNQTITLAGWSNIVSIGTGTSTLTIGIGYAKIHTDGGDVSITAHGNANVIDAGAGTNTIAIDSGSVHNTVFMNASGQGLTTLTGFSTSHYDVLDLTRTLAGTNIASDLSNIGAFVTASASAAGTTLSIDPTGGGGSAYAFGFLAGTSTSLAALVQNGGIRVTAS